MNTKRDHVIIASSANRASCLICDESKLAKHIKICCLCGVRVCTDCLKIFHSNSKLNITATAVPSTSSSTESGPTTESMSGSTSSSTNFPNITPVPLAVPFGETIDQIQTSECFALYILVTYYKKRMLIAITIYSI